MRQASRHHRVAPLLLLAAAPALAGPVQDCDGCVPLNDLGPGLYLGAWQGGLYSGGLNQPPAAHAADALAAAARIVPRDGAGLEDPTGKIGLVSISMSNCNQEFSAFERRADLDDHRSAHVRVVNGCQGGQALDVIADPSALYWTHLSERVTAAGLTPEQVQAVWIKMGDGAVPTLDFPDHAHNEMASAEAVLQVLKTTFPNLGLAFFSSRIYGGYTSEPTRGEPLCYETGFAVKWLIEAQIAGDPGLNHDPASGPVLAPLILWGPYLWANGPTPRSDGLAWLPEDLESDGVHPSASGEQKVAELLEALVQLDPFATPWYGDPTHAHLVALDAVADAGVSANQPHQNLGSEPVLGVADTTRHAYVKFDLSALTGTVEQAKLSLITPPGFTCYPGTQLRGVSDDSWQEDTLTFANAPPMDGAVHGDLPTLSRGTATSFDVTADVVANPAGVVSFGITSAAGAGDPKQFLSREGGEPPRLILTVRPPCEEPGVPYCRALANSTGAAADLTLAGSASIGQDDLELRARDLPPGVPALFIYAPDHLQVPFGEGLRCVGGGIARLIPPLFADSAGRVSLALDFTQPPLGSGPNSVQPGDTIYLQCWHRDPAGGPAGYNLTDGYAVTFCP